MKLAFPLTFYYENFKYQKSGEKFVYSKHSHTQHLVATINILLHVLLHIYPSTIRFIHPSFYLIFLDAFQSELKTSVQFTSKNFSMHLINQSSMFEMVLLGGVKFIQFHAQILILPFCECRRIHTLP